MLKYWFYIKISIPNMANYAFVLADSKEEAIKKVQEEWKHKTYRDINVLKELPGNETISTLMYVVHQIIVQ